MGSKRPRPTLINEPSNPVYSLLDDAKAAVRKFEYRVSDLPKLEWAVYQYVVGYHYGKFMETSEIVRRVGFQEEASPTGVRGALSRLVDKGFLVRPEVGYYWPACRRLPE